MCANHPEQYAIKPALEGPQDHLTEVRKKLRSRRDLTVQWCNSTPRVSCVSPRGAFYAFPRIDIPEGDDVFVKELILQKHVMVVHGSGFGQKPGTKHFRIVFLPDEKTLARPTRRLRRSSAADTGSSDIPTRGLTPYFSGAYHAYLSRPAWSFPSQGVLTKLWLLRQRDQGAAVFFCESGSFLSPVTEQWTRDDFLVICW